jgi:hypothetical protein
MDTTQQLRLGIGRIFQGNQLGGEMNGDSTLLTHAFQFFTHDITSSTLVISGSQPQRKYPEKQVLARERWRLAIKVIIFWHWRQIK